MPPPLVLHTESSLGFGGQEIRTLGEIAWLRRHGWDSALACQPRTRTASEAEARGIPVVPLAMPGSANARAVLTLRRLMRERAVALVHTHSSIDSWLATVAAKSLGLPVVRSRHVSIPIRRWRALVYHLADRIVTSGEAVREIVAAAGVRPNKIVAVSAGLDRSRFHPGVSGEAVRNELGLTGPVVGLVANIRGSKGHAVLLEATRHILATLPDTRFLFVGDGVAADAVRQRIIALGLDRHVIMTGFRRDIPEVMAALDVLVVPSLRTEATPQVVPQALAIGTPVVGSTIGGIPEIIRDGETGRLVPPGDPAALAAAILDVLRDPAGAKRMVAAGQALVFARFSVDTVMARTVAIYEELLAKRPGREGPV